MFTQSISEMLGKLLGLFMLEPLTLLLLFFLFLILYYRWLHINTNSTNTIKTMPPSPPKLPIVGNIHQVSSGGILHRSLQSLSRKYGNIIMLHMGSKPTLVISSSELARQILKTHDVESSNRPQTRIFKAVFYNCKDVASSNYGEKWRQMKSICVLHLFSNTRVRSFRRIREEEVSSMTENIRISGPSLPVNLSETILTLTNNFTGKVVLGRNYSGPEEDDAKMRAILAELVMLLGAVDVREFIPWISWIIDRVSTLDARVQKVAEVFDQFLEGVIQEHIDRLNEQENQYRGDQKVEDFVDVLLKVQMDKSAAYQINRDDIKAILVDIFTGGTHTSYTAIEWALAELLSHPQAMKKLQEEVRILKHGKPGTLITEQELEGEKLMYLRAVIKEALRLHPPLPLLFPRQLAQDVKVQGFDIAAGTQVIINAWAIHRDPVIWKEPDKFCPERFLESQIDFKGQDFELIPFSSGRRKCPAILYSNVMIELVLANLMYGFDWTLPCGAKGEDLDMSEKSGITANIKQPLLAVATPYYDD